MWYEQISSRITVESRAWLWPPHHWRRLQGLLCTSWLTGSMWMYTRPTSRSTQPGGRLATIWFGDISTTWQYSCRGKYSLAVLDPRVGHTMDVLSPFISILCHSDWLFHRESCPWLDAVYQAMRGLPRLHTPGIVPCIISFSRQFPCCLMVWPQYASFFAFTVSNSSLFTPALLRTHSFVFFADHETRRIFFSPFISKESRRVSSFFLSVQLSQPYVTTGHTSAFISLVFVEIGILSLFHIFCSDAPTACPLLNLVRNSVVHSLSSIIRDPRYGNVFTCASCSLWSPYGIGQTIIFSRCSLFFFYLSSFLFSSPYLSRRRLDVCHTSTRGVALVRI